MWIDITLMPSKPKNKVLPKTATNQKAPTLFLSLSHGCFFSMLMSFSLSLTKNSYLYRPALSAQNGRTPKKQEKPNLYHVAEAKNSRRKRRL